MALVSSLRRASASALVALLATATVSVPACSNKSGTTEGGTEGQPVRETRGTIKEVRDEGKTLVIAHEEIPGFMKAMTMPFVVPSAELSKGLAAGDAVSLSFAMNREGKLVIKTIEKR